MNINDFIEKHKPHCISNGAPPWDCFKRHEWESKQLYTIFEKISEGCHILDYGCGSNGTLQYTLFNHCPNSNYYGLELKNHHGDNQGFSVFSSDKVYLGYIDELDAILPKIDAMVLGSVFTHLPTDKIVEILDKTLPCYEKGFQIGFTFFESSDLTYYNGNHYNSESFWIVTLTKDFLQDYCKKNKLKLIIHDFVQQLDHTIPLGLTYQSFATIKKL
jgi:hypothetical protein